MQQTRANQQQSKVKTTSVRTPAKHKQDLSWPFPPPGGPTGPCKQPRTKRADKASVEEFGEALF